MKWSRYSKHIDGPFLRQRRRSTAAPGRPQTLQNVGISKDFQKQSLAAQEIMIRIDQQDI